MGPQGSLEPLQLGFLVLLELSLGLQRMVKLIVEGLQPLLSGFGTHRVFHDNLERYHTDLELRVCLPRQSQSQDTNDERRPHPHMGP
jgi:hypothetical protein